MNSDNFSKAEQTITINISEDNNINYNSKNTHLLKLIQQVMILLRLFFLEIIQKIMSQLLI